MTGISLEAQTERVLRAYDARKGKKNTPAPKVPEPILTTPALESEPTPEPVKPKGAVRTTPKVQEPKYYFENSGSFIEWPYPIEFKVRRPWLGEQRSDHEDCKVNDYYIDQNLGLLVFAGKSPTMAVIMRPATQAEKDGLASAKAPKPELPTKVVDLFTAPSAYDMMSMHKNQMPSRPLKWNGTHRTHDSTVVIINCFAERLDGCIEFWTTKSRLTQAQQNDSIAETSHKGSVLWNSKSKTAPGV